MCLFIPFGFDGGIWVVIVLIPDHGLYIYFIGVYFVLTLSVVLALKVHESV